MKGVVSIIVCFCVSIGLAKAQNIETIAGGGTNPNDGVPATIARIISPNTICFDKWGNYLLSCPLDHKIRRIDVSGIITTIAGTGNGGYNGDGGLADTSRVRGACSATVDSIGNIYIADIQNHRIRKIDASTGIISTIAGTGVNGYSGDGGLATDAMLNYPNFVYLDHFGNIYVSDPDNSRVRKIDANGIISTVVGTGVYGSDGDGGLAISAKIGKTRSILKDANENLYIADMDYNYIRKVDASTGIISTIAGTGFSNYLYNGDNIPAITANIRPHILAFDNTYTNLYVSDRENDRIRKINLTTGLISTVAGDGTMAQGGDGGPATSAQLNRGYGITFDTCNNLYITQVNDGRIRKVTFHPDCFPTNINRTLPISFSIYPNPVHSQVTVTGERLKGMTITNTLGQVILQEKCNGNTTVINMNDYSAGMYFITVSDQAGQKLTKKLLKE